MQIFFLFTSSWWLIYYCNSFYFLTSFKIYLAESHNVLKSIIIRRPVGKAMTGTFLKLEVRDSYLRSIKSDIVLPDGSPPLQHFSERSYVTRRCNEMKMGPAYRFQASA